MAVDAAMNMSVTGNQTVVRDLGTARFPYALSLSHSLTDGTAAGQADRVFSDQRTLAASATEDLDLAGVLTDAFGTVMTFAKVKAIFVKAATANTNDVNITRPASNGAPLFLAAGDGIAVKPGYGFAWFGSGAGFTVTAGTGDLLTFTNSAAGTGVTYDVVIIGTSA